MLQKESELVAQLYKTMAQIQMAIALQRKEAQQRVGTCGYIFKFFTRPSKHNLNIAMLANLVKWSTRLAAALIKELQSTNVPNNCKKKTQSIQLKLEANVCAKINEERIKLMIQIK